MEEYSRAAALHLAAGVQLAAATVVTLACVRAAARSLVESDEKVAEERDELLPLRRGEVRQQPLLVAQVGLDGVVDEGSAVIGERDQLAAPVSRIRLAPDEPPRLETVQSLGHATGRDHGGAAELARRQPVRRAGSPQGGKDVEVAAGEAVAGEDAVDLALRQRRDARDPADHGHRAGVEVGSLAAPLSGDPVDGVRCLGHGGIIAHQKVA